MKNYLLVAVGFLSYKTLDLGNPIPHQEVKAGRSEGRGGEGVPDFTCKFWPYSHFLYTKDIFENSQIMFFLGSHFTLYGYITNSQSDQLPAPSWIDSSVVKALHQYRKGHHSRVQNPVQA